MPQSTRRLRVAVAHLVGRRSRRCRWHRERVNRQLRRRERRPSCPTGPGCWGWNCKRSGIQGGRARQRDVQLGAHEDFSLWIPPFEDPSRSLSSPRGSLAAEAGSVTVEGWSKSCAQGSIPLDCLCSGARHRRPSRNGLLDAVPVAIVGEVRVEYGAEVELGAMCAKVNWVDWGPERTGGRKGRAGRKGRTSRTGRTGRGGGRR